MILDYIQGSLSHKTHKTPFSDINLKKSKWNLKRINVPTN